jgi:hypothetical protein
MEQRDLEMSRPVALSDSAYERLNATARGQGPESVEQFLEQWPIHTVEDSPFSEEDLRQRQDLVDEIDAIRAEAEAACGVMPDSVELIREDRER